MNISTQLCQEISVAGTFISCLQFHTKPRLEYLVFEKKKNTLRLCLVNQTFLYCLRSEIVLLRPEFYLLPPWPAPTLVAAILFLPDSAEFFKRCASAQTCTVHEIYPLTDDFNVSDATCAYSASCIKKGRLKLGTFCCPTHAREDFEGSVFYIFSRELCFFFQCYRLLLSFPFLHRSTLTSQTLNMSVIKKANFQYIVHRKLSVMNPLIGRGVAAFKPLSQGLTKIWLKFQLM